MRATLEIPDALIDDLLKVTGERTKTRAICLAIKDYVHASSTNLIPEISKKFCPYYHSKKCNMWERYKYATIFTVKCLEGVTWAVT